MTSVETRRVGWSLTADPTADGFAVSLAGLCKRFGRVVALDSVDLEVAPGEVHGLLGPNGAGKTTLLRILLGLVRADSGSVRMLGRPAPVTGRRLPEGVGGFVETPRFYPYLSARRNLGLLAELDRPGGPSVPEVLRRVGLADRAGERVRGYSLGMRQRLGLAAALLRAPSLLIVDEPVTGLDPAGIRDVRTLLADLAGAGSAVLLSSHDMGEVEQLCSAVTVLREGAVVYRGPLEQLRARAPTPASRLTTSDDAAALALAVTHPGVDATAHPAGGLLVRAGTADLDQLVHALSRSGVAVRGLAVESTAVEAAFFALTVGNRSGMS